MRLATVIFACVFVATLSPGWGSAMDLDARQRAKTPAGSGSAKQDTGDSSIANADVIKLVKAGLSDDIVTGAVRAAATRKFDLTPSGLVELKKAGVSDSIIAVMMQPYESPGASGPGASAAREIRIPDGTDVRLSLLDRLHSSSAQVNDRVRFSVVEDVSVSGVVVIAKGAEAHGTVIEASHKKSFGRSGKLNFTVDSVTAVDGSNVRLRSTKANKGDDSYGKAGVVTLLTGPFGVFVKGKDVEISPGTEYTIYIDGDRSIQLPPGH